MDVGYHIAAAYDRMRLAAALVVVAATVALAPGAVRQDPRALAGWATYERSCAPCHGTDGGGHGPAAAFTRGDPRVFTKGEYEWRSTPAGKPPTDDDLRAAIRFGAPGTSMPAFGETLSPADV